MFLYLQTFFFWVLSKQLFASTNKYQKINMVNAGTLLGRRRRAPPQYCASIDPSARTVERGVVVRWPPFVAFIGVDNDLIKGGVPL